MQYNGSLKLILIIRVKCSHLSTEGLIDFMVFNLTFLYSKKLIIILYKYKNYIIENNCLHETKFNT